MKITFTEALVVSTMAALFAVILTPLSNTQMWLGLALIALAILGLLHQFGLDSTIIELAHAIAEYISKIGHK